MSPTFTGKDTIPIVFGPLGKSVDDLALWMKTALTEKYHTEPDPYIKLLPFNSHTYLSHQKKTLKIGYFLSHEVLETTAASQRAVSEVVQALKQLGHEVVEIELPNFVNIFQAFFAEISSEGNFKSFDEIL
jgi:Asp-tRNA(Asn)/Glu-tRNA(Gln) amidotransferase A subunit family amidase